MRQDFESKARKGGKDFSDKTNFGWRREVEEVEEENLNHFEDFDLDQPTIRAKSLVIRWELEGQRKMINH